MESLGVLKLLANNLKVLLAERNLKIKDVIENTNLSRNTVSNIVNNPCSNVSNNTIDEICNYLNIEPSVFFVYTPYLIRYSSKNFSLSIQKGKQKFECQLKLNKITFNELSDLDSNKETIKETFKNDIENIDQHYSIFDLEILSNKEFNFMNTYKKLPFVFQSEITHNLIKMCNSYLANFYDKHKDLPRNSYITFFNGGGLIIPANNFEK